MGFSFVHPKKTASDLDLLFLFSLFQHLLIYSDF